ncbi:hypothetical protein BDN72DRAFT_163359 [Pluteus cervinus]|uniref:Uncharacterized protein n=1 Tax=Pluteus cervinus TaxID=181527 RepID=A0ACD3AKN9_9AGAR|nr:hypothetical protein BDN72DRAFT_163359 [Pluteus cervinus]
MRVYSNYETRKRLELDAFPQYSSPSLTRTRGPKDDQDFTIEGFGDISLSNENFLPLPSPAPAPRKKIKKLLVDNDTKAKTVSSRAWEELDVGFESPTKGRFMMDRQFQHKLPSLMQNILPPSPSRPLTPLTTKEPTFDDLFEALILGDRRSAERIIGKESYSHVVGRPATAASHLRKNSNLNTESKDLDLKLDATADFRLC